MPFRWLILVLAGLGAMPSPPRLLAQDLDLEFPVRAVFQELAARGGNLRPTMGRMKPRCPTISIPRACGRCSSSSPPTRSGAPAFGTCGRTQ